MAINRFDDEPYSGKPSLTLRNPDWLYTHSEICDLLEKAEAMGFSLDVGSDLEGLTVRELDVLVNRIQ